MRIVVLTPADHFHAPIILRALGVKQPSDEVIVITTPKLGSRGSVLARLSRLIKESGYDYLLSMMAAKLCHLLFGLWERLVGRTVSEREFISVREVITHFRFTHYAVPRINARSSVALLQSLKPGVLITVFFNQVLKERVLAIPRYGCLNIHPSYLPAYRGISPSFWMLARNETMGGVSIHYLTSGIDNGAILWQEAVKITTPDTFFSLYRRCAVRAAEALPNVLMQTVQGAAGKPQDETHASYFHEITPASVRRFRSLRRRFAWLA